MLKKYNYAPKHDANYGKYCNFVGNYLQLRDMSGKKSNIVRFWHKHPVMMNFFTIVAVAIILIWLIGVVFLNFWTRHGDEVAMPQVENLNVDDAGRVLKSAGFEVTLDSVYSSETAPGTVIRQVPREGSMVKSGGMAYLQYVCYSTKKAKIPEFIDGPLASAMNNFKSRGFENIDVIEVPSDHNDLVLGATYNGIELHPGMEVPVTAHIVIKVAICGRFTDTGTGTDTIYQEDADAQFIEDLFDEESIDEP